MKRYSISLDIGEKHIKTTEPYTYIPSIMGIMISFQRLKISCFGNYLEKLEPSCIAVGKKNGTITLDNGLSVF